MTTAEPGELGRLLDFLIELDKLKGVLRKTKPAGFERYENSAEHSWHVCMAAIALASGVREPVDVTRAVEMLLVHDIPEIDVGDSIVYARREGSPDAERAAARRIFALLPRAQASLCLDRWEEYEARQTPEARYAYAIDRLLPVLHNLQNDGGTWREHRIALDQVLGLNQAIGDALPEVWAHVRGRIEAFAREGVFNHS